MTGRAAGATRSLREAIEEATARLAAAGVPSPRVDAEEIAAHVLDVDRAALWSRADLGEAAGEFRALVVRRAAREPLQHITGRAWFRYLELAVGPGVFVPRPETEVVAGAAVAEVARRRSETADEIVAVDLCSGSGAIALAVATEAAPVAVHAVEADPVAAAWAQRNVRSVRERTGAYVDLVVGDMATAFGELDGRVDVVTANPPYIPVGADIRDPEVAAHDPAVALWSGSDGLDAMRVVEQVAARLLRPGGLVVAEHADVQGESAPAVFHDSGRWDAVHDHPDLARRPRFLTARRRRTPR